MLSDTGQSESLWMVSGTPTVLPPLPGDQSAAFSDIGVPASYWEIEYEGRIYPWRPVHPSDESDLPQLTRSAIPYLRGGPAESVGHELRRC
jgi:hypothetical protein